MYIYIGKNKNRFQCSGCRHDFEVVHGITRQFKLSLRACDILLLFDTLLALSFSWSEIIVSDCMLFSNPHKGESIERANFSVLNNKFLIR